MSALQLLMRARRGEVHVARDDVPRPDEDARDEVLGAAPLVGRDDVPEAVDLAHGGLEAVEGFRAGVGLVARHHGCPLPVAHGVRAAVGEEVDVDVLALQ